MKEIKKKIQVQYFKEVAEGKKDFEIRKDDSDYEVGDTLILQEGEYDYPIVNGIFKGWEYTGKEIAKRIKYKITHEEFPQGIQEGYCILGLEEIEPQKVYVHIIAAKEGILKGIPMPALFTTREKLEEHEKYIETREDAEVLQVVKVEINKEYGQRG